MAYTLWVSSPDAELAQLRGHSPGPILIGSGTGWTGMEDLAESGPDWRTGPDWRILLSENCDGTFRREIADADNPVRRQNANDFPEVIVAPRKERVALTRWEFVRRPIASAFFEKGERAIVHDQMFLEEFLGCPETFREQPPESLAADFAAMTIETSDESFGMFARRAIDLCLDAEPVADGRDFAEGDTGLRHAEGARVHPEKQDPFRIIPGAPQINLVATPGVTQRIVNVRDGRGELQGFDRIS